jgi:hypothetical protein
MTKLKGALCDNAKAPNKEFITQNHTTFELPQLEDVCVIVCVCVCVYIYIYVYIKVKRSRYRPGVAQRVPGS